MLPRPSMRRWRPRWGSGSVGWGCLAVPMYVVPSDAECEVLLQDGAWYFGVVAEWRRNDQDTWSAYVRYSAPDGNRIDTFPADRVRRSQVDYSLGRQSSP